MVWASGEVGCEPRDHRRCHAGPVATGRAGSALHRDHDPGKSAVSMPAIRSAAMLSVSVAVWTAQRPRGTVDSSRGDAGRKQAIHEESNDGGPAGAAIR